MIYDQKQVTEFAGNKVEFQVLFKAVNFILLTSRWLVNWDFAFIALTMLLPGLVELQMRWWKLVPKTKSVEDQSSLEIK